MNKAPSGMLFFILFYFKTKREYTFYFLFNLIYNIKKMLITCILKKEYK